MRKIIFFIIILSLFSCSEDRDLPSGDENSPATGTQNKDLEFTKVQDSILKNYSSAVRLINQIDTELSKLAKVPETSESYNLEQEILQKIDYLSFQLKTQNEDITKLELKIKSLGKENKTYIDRIKTIESIIAEKDKIIANQTERIGSLEIELASTKNERDFAISEKQNVERFAEETKMQKNTAFYIIGTEKFLKEQNIIQMQGEGFLGIGGKYVPSSDVELKYFTKIDITKDSLISFPSNMKIEEIVSTHSRRLMDLLNSPSGTDHLKIKNPDVFWRTDKMLIIMIEEK